MMDIYLKIYFFISMFLKVYVRCFLETYYSSSRQIQEHFPTDLDLNPLQRLERLNGEIL